MKILQSLNPEFIRQNFEKTVRRFPLVIFCSLVAAIFMEMQISINEDKAFSSYIFTAVIGISTFTSIYLFFETYTGKLKRELVFALAAVVLGIICWLNPGYIGSSYFRLLQFLLAAHLLVAVAPYLNSKENSNVWFFNESLFLRFVLSSIYSGVLLAGLFAILASCQALFDMKIDAVFYRYIALFCAFIFHPIHFLSGTPVELNRLSQTINYPNALRIFCQYLLVPLVITYGSILIIYSLKIIIVQSWPKGMVSGLVLGYGVVGIFTALMVNPLVHDAGFGWARKYNKFFHCTLVPLSILMFAAVIRRLDEYGLTESRYFAIIIALWFLGTSLYVLLKKNNDIRIIPISLLGITLVSSFGPWGAYSWSLRDQKKRVEKILKTYEVLVNGKVNKDHKKLKAEDAKKVTNLLSYMTERHGIRSMEEWFPEKAFNKKSSIAVKEILAQMNIEPVFKYGRDFQSSFENVSLRELQLNNKKKIYFVSTQIRRDRDAQWDLVKHVNDIRFLRDTKIVFQEDSKAFIKRLGLDKDPEKKVPNSLKISTVEFEAEVFFYKVSGSIEADYSEADIYSLEGVVIE